MYWSDDCEVACREIFYQLVDNEQFFFYEKKMCQVF